MPEKTWYFLPPTSKARDLYNILHLPYTGMVLSFALMGGLLAPSVHADRMAALAVAYFLGLGLAAHAFDQLDPKGSHYVQHLTRGELLALGVGALAAAVAVGGYYVVVLSPLLAPFIFAEAFFALAYPLPSYVLRGAFHNRAAFAFSWGYLPFLSGYFANALVLTPASLALGVAPALASWIELTLSRSARMARADGRAAGYAREERGLKVMVVCLYLAAGAMALSRILFP